MVSALDDATLARMRAEAAVKAGPFVDPALLRDADALLPGIDAEWLARIIGHPVRSYRTFTNAELFLAVHAAQADAEYLRALAAARRAEQGRAGREAAAAAQAQAQAVRDAWQALASRLPVPVAVWHNWTARHLDGYEQGADHIAVLEDLHAGRLRRRARSPLCWTPSRAHELRHVTGNVGDELRPPNCKACLRHARRLAEISDPTED